MGTENERRLVALATAQLGLVTPRQCAKLGLSKTFVQSRLGSGAWQRIHRGVFKAGVGPLSADEWDVAALLRAGPGAVLSHHSAARHLGLEVPQPERVQVTIPMSRRGPTTRQLDVWRSRDLAAEDVMARGPVRFTRLGRTMLDLAGVLEDRWLRAAVDSALRRRSANLGWMLRVTVERGRGHKGAERLGALLGDYAATAEVPDSALESLAVELTSRTGSKPKLHHRIYGRRGFLAEVDLAWPSERLCVELDGWKYHGNREAFAKDRLRDRALFAQGWAVLRYTWEEISFSPDRVSAELAQALRIRTESWAGTAAPREP